MVLRRGGRRRPRLELGSIDLLEEATHLLRRAPVSAWLAYLAGTLPFLLALLFFWADMSRGARAWERLPLSALLLVLLLVAMKTGHALFADALLRALHGEAPRPFLGRLPRLVLAQAALQPWGLFLLPVALLLTLPFGWCYALFQNHALFGQGEAPLREELRRSWEQARLWPGQNHLTLGLLSLCGLILLLGLAAFAFILPHLLQMLFGLDTVFSRSHQHLLNTTFWTAVIALAWLLLDPLVKAVYVLRCFHGLSLASGADLRAELRRLGARAATAGALVLAAVSLLLPAPAPAWAAESAPVAPAQLRRALAAELSEVGYSWRMPREAAPDKEIPGFVVALGEAIDAALRWLGEQLKGALRTLADWLKQLIPHLRPEGEAPRPGPWEGADPLLLGLWFFLAVALALAAVWLLRLWRKRRAERAALAAPPLTAIPDLEAEEISAAELPTGRWLGLAQELLARGETRLALRALSLAALAHLAELGLLTLARYKSNRDYLGELRRRAHSVPQVVVAWEETLLPFERVWYGDHVADAESVAAFRASIERILHHGRG